MGLLKEFAIQLYSLREETAKDFGAVLDSIGKIGYTGVEFAGYGGLSADDMKARLAQNGLAVVGSHVGMERLENHLDEELAYNRALGTGTIVLPHYAMETLADAETLAEKLRPIAEKVRGAGFGFAYHNHSHEFATENDAYLLDRLAELVPAELMGLELDIYWAARAGVDVPAYLKKHAGRIRLVHVKQMASDKSCVDLPDGVLDYASLIRLGQSLGVEHFILEQESFAVSAQTSVERNFEYIMGLK